MTQPIDAGQAAFKSFSALLARYENSPNDLVGIYLDVTKPITDRAHRREFSIGVIDLLHKLGPRDEAAVPVLIRHLRLDIDSQPGLMRELGDAFNAGAKAVLATLPKLVEAQMSPDQLYVERMLTAPAVPMPGIPVACAYPGYKGAPRC